MVGLDIGIRAIARFLIGRDHQGWSIAEQIHGGYKKAKVAPDDNQIRAGPT